MGMDAGTYAHDETYGLDEPMPATGGDEEESSEGAATDAGRDTAADSSELQRHLENAPAQYAAASRKATLLEVGIAKVCTVDQ